MKRIVAIGAIIVVLFAAAWSLFWWLGRDALLRAFDAEVARLEAAGWTIDWTDRDIGGFPFGYTMRLTGLAAREPASGFAVRLPHATVENDGADGVLVRLPETFAADLPLPASQGSEGSVEPVISNTTGEASGLVVRLAGASGPERLVGVEAEALAWRMQLPGSPREQAISFKALDADISSGGGETAFRIEAGRYGVEAAMVEGDGPPSSMAADYRDLTVTGNTSVATLEALEEMLYAGAPGELDLAMQAGPAEARLVGGEGERRGTLDWRGGSISAIATLSSGRIDLQGEARQNVWTLTPESAGTLVPGELSAGMVQTTYSMPMAPAPEPDDMAIRVALLDMTLDETAWATIDPEGALPREAAELVIDLGGTARVTRRIDAMRPGQAPPFEVAKLDIKEVALDGLGATARATGSVEFLQPIGLPLGTVDVTLTGASALIGALGRAGVLTLDQVEMADAMLTVYAQPVEGKDAWTTDITFSNDGPLVNGLPIR